MQRGSIRKEHGAWMLRYWETEIRDGQRARRKKCARLAPISPDYPDKRSVLLLAEKILSPINAGTVQPESSQRVRDFIELLYLPHVKSEVSVRSWPS